MNKHLLLILLGFGLIGCAITPPLYVENRTSNTKYGNWNYVKNVDEFDGELHISYVQSSDKNGLIRVLTQPSTNQNRLEYTNGDSYVCVLSYSLKADTIFYKDSGEEYRYEVRFALSTDRTVLILRLIGGDDKLNDLLNKYDTMKIRTTDSCGTVITNTFNIKGTTHLRTLI